MDADATGATGRGLQVDLTPPIARLTLQRPERLNAVDEGMYEALLAALQAAAADRRVRAVLLGGAGRAFCVGADLQQHATGGRDLAQRRRYVELGQRAAAAVLRCRVPVIAAIGGHAIGAGLELALCCDLSVVASDAKLRLPELGLGTFVGGAVTATLVQRAGLTRARELLLLGRFFSGADAVAWGLCNAHVAAAEVPAAALALAGEVAAKAPRSVTFAKEQLLLARERSLDDVLAAEALALLACMGTRDWQEGIDAFAAKRTPEFTGE